MKVGTIHNPGEGKHADLILKSMELQANVLQKGGEYPPLSIQRDMIMTEDTPAPATIMGTTLRMAVIPVLIMAVPITLILTKLTLTPLMITILTMLVTSVLIMITKMTLSIVTKMSAQASMTEWNVLSEDHPVLLINHLAEQNDLQEALREEQAIPA